jgi:BlaI family penicillinase repressor
MKQIPKISDTEWQVMKVIWAKNPVTASQVIEELSDSTYWKPKTVKTLLGRLVKKKAAGFEKENRTYLYYPLIAEAECIKAESQSFLKRVYNGALGVMLASFLEEQELSPKEIEELKRILNGKKS